MIIKFHSVLYNKNLQDVKMQKQPFRDIFPDKTVKAVTSKHEEFRHIVPGGPVGREFHVL